MSKYVLLTGATGLLGEYLLRDLLREGFRVAIVARPNRRMTVQQRAESIMQMWEAKLGELLPRPVVWRGDVSEPNLGLEDDAQEWIQHNCDRVLHNAAVLTFHGPDRRGEPWRTNLCGTRHVLEFCERRKINNFHYVSTSYVCGLRKPGRVAREDELDAGQEFRNDYETSKFEAEKLVRAADFINSLTVYRPAVIVGDSQTGYTATYHGLHMYLKLMAVLIGNVEPDSDGVRHTPVYMPNDGDEPRNTVPVDWVSAAITRIFGKPEAHGRTFHLTPDEPITARELIEVCCEYFNTCGVVWGSDKIGLNQFDRTAHEHLNVYHDYLTTDPEFDKTNTLRFVPDLPCPKIDKPMIHRFLRYGQRDRWGKRRRPTPLPKLWSSDVLSRLSAGEAYLHSSRLGRNVGLDVIGPGGGQFQVATAGREILNIEPGLPHASDPVIKLTTDELGRMFERSGQSAQAKP